MKPLIVDLPYPNVTPQKDLRSAGILSYAYASLKGELTAVLQYVYHHYYFDVTDQETAKTLECISLAEMMHFEMLGKAILALGGNPNYIVHPKSAEIYNAGYVSTSTTPQKMLMDDVMGEMEAISTYQKMIFALKNEEVSALVERIVLDEQLHLQTLRNLLQRYSKSSCKIY